MAPLALGVGAARAPGLGVGWVVVGGWGVVGGGARVRGEGVGLGADGGGAAGSSSRSVSPHPLALSAGVALSYAVGAAVLAASGSASVGQLLGAVGLSVAGVGLLGVGGSGVALVTSYAPLPLAALYAHHFLSPSLPTPVGALLVVLPLPLVLAPRGWWGGGRWRQVGVALALVGCVALVLVALVGAVELARAAARAADPYGGYGY